VIRPEIRQRFRAVVARAIERSDREQAEHLASIRPYRKRAPGDAFRSATGKRPR